jgi:hypothetical protein
MIVSIELWPNPQSFCVVWTKESDTKMISAEF